MSQIGFNLLTAFIFPFRFHAICHDIVFQKEALQIKRGRKKEEEIKNHYKREIRGEDMRVDRIRNDTSEYAEDVGGEEMELKIRMYDADLVVKRLQN